MLFDLFGTQRRRLAALARRESRRADYEARCADAALTDAARETAKRVSAELQRDEAEKVISRVREALDPQAPSSCPQRPGEPHRLGRASPEVSAWACRDCGAPMTCPHDSVYERLEYADVACGRCGKVLLTHREMMGCRSSLEVHDLLVKRLGISPQELIVWKGYGYMPARLLNALGD